MLVKDFYNKNPFPVINDYYIIILNNIVTHDEPLYDNVLSVGCGTIQPISVTKQNIGRNYTFVDFSNNSIDIANSYIGTNDHTWIVSDILDAELTNYDNIIMTGVLHHNENDKIIMEKLRDHANTGCMIEIMVYNADSELRTGTREVMNNGYKWFTDVKDAREQLDFESFSNRYIWKWLKLHQDTDDQIIDTWMHPLNREYTANSILNLMTEYKFMPIKLMKNDIDTQISVIGVAS